MKYKSLPFKVILTVAALAVFTEGQAAFVSVCERTPAVTKFIERTLKKPCADISEEDLATLKRIAVPRQGIKSFLAHDFANLPNLEILNITGNPVETLTPGLLDGLFKLKTFVLFRTPLKAVPEDFLDKMDNIEKLHIFSNKFTELPPAVMDRLLRAKNLKVIDMSRSLNAEQQAQLREHFPVKGPVALSFL